MGLFDFLKKKSSSTPEPPSRPQTPPDTLSPSMPVDANGHPDFAAMKAQLASVDQQMLPMNIELSKDLDFILEHAEQGHPAAQYKLGMAYFNGNEDLGIPVDRAKARFWLEKAYAQGYGSIRIRF